MRRVWHGDLFDRMPALKRVLARPSAVCVLASGGLDSSVLIAELLAAGRRVFPLYVRGGFRWEEAELFWLRRFLRSLKRTGLEPLAVADVPVDWALKGHWGLTGRGVPGAE